MRYETIGDLPDTIKTVLPEEAQEIYLEAYQKSWDNYKEHMGGELSQASVAHRDGWSAMKKVYIEDEKTGEWYRRDEAPEEVKEENSPDRV
jgi:cation transport regulator